MKEFGTKSMKLDGKSGLDYFNGLSKALLYKIKAICGIDKWCHIAIVKDNSRRKLFKNGKYYSDLLDGTGDYLKLPDHKDWKFDKGDFTVEGYFRFLVRIREWSFVAKYNLINSIYPLSRSKNVR